MLYLFCVLNAVVVVFLWPFCLVIDGVCGTEYPFIMFVGMVFIL
jgi:hypothetical protein